MKGPFRTCGYAFSLGAVFILSVIASCSASDSHAKAIDRTIVRSVDLTRDGRPEKVTLRIRGKDIGVPFRWEIDIISGKKRIYHQERLDTHWDQFFNNPHFLGSACGDYESCKKKWYFDDMLDCFLIEAGPSLLEVLENRGLATRTLSELEDMILQTGKATFNEARMIIESLKEDLASGKAIGIQPDVNPIEGTGIAIWIPAIDGFIKVYND